MDAAEFFTELYGETEGWLQLWRLDTKATWWLRYPLITPLSVENYVKASWEKPFNAYFGVCLQGVESGHDSRGKASKVTVVPGMWADVDFATKDQRVKNKKTYPTRDQAEEAIKELGLAPTITIESGGGWHLYWLFGKPFQITDDITRKHIEGVVKSWQRKLRVLLMAKGASLDSTHDLCRVLRIPGSTNTKVINGGGTHDVRIVGEIGQRYKISDFESEDSQTLTINSPKTSRTGTATAHKAPSMTSDPPSTSKPSESTYGAPSFSPELATLNAEPPATKLLNFCEIDENFKRTWSNDVKKYQSSSEYHMALANYAIGAEWSVEEAAALIVAFTREHYSQNMVKVLRINNGVQDYLHRTIGKAYDHRLETEQGDRSERAATELAIIVRESGDEGTDIDRQVVLDHITSMLGVTVVGFSKTGSGGNFEYSISVIRQGGKKPVDCLIGNSASALRPDALACALFDGIDYVFIVNKKIRAQWGAILQGLMKIVEKHEITEVSYAARTCTIIEELLRVGGYEEVKTKSARNEQLIERRPYLENGKLYLPGSAVRKLTTENDALLGHSIFAELRKMNFKQKTVSGRETSRSYWVLDDPKIFMGVIKSSMSSVLGGSPEGNGEA